MTNKEELIKKQIVKIISETTNDLTSIISSLDDCFEKKQYHMVLYNLQIMKNTIEQHSFAVNWLCFNHGDNVDQKILNYYRKGSNVLVDKFEKIYEGIYKDVISNYTMDDNEYQ